MLFVVISLSSVNWCHGTETELPCQFNDSINITAGIIHPNNSITFDGTEFKIGHYAQINYTQNGDKRTTVDPYTRGCRCTNKSCVRLCCPYASFMETNANSNTITCRTDEAAKNLIINLSDTDNQTLVVDENFGHVEQICEHRYYEDDYTINEVLF